MVDRSKRLLVYPSPATRTINIKGAEGLEIIISDGSGKTITVISAGESKTGVDISTLSPGIYYCKAEGLTASFIKVNE